MVCLAEGLQQLGIQCYSNRNYWKSSTDDDTYLLCNDPEVGPDDCSIVILDDQWVNCYSALPENFFHPDRKYLTVYLDGSDGFLSSAWSGQFRKFDFIFRTHCSQEIQYPPNFIPWCFGISNRILCETRDAPTFNARHRRLLVNFRVEQDVLKLFNLSMKFPQGVLTVPEAFLKLDYPVRQIAHNRLLPLVEDILPGDCTVDSFNDPSADSYHHLQWVQTGRRHYPSYYQRLKQSAACAGFGGCMILNPFTGEQILQWWDSWRFWESLAAGCVTFHVDFEKYGVSLPVMPQNWQHYIGIDLHDIQATVDRITDEPEILERISVEGRQWAIANYGPVPTALRFLEIIGSSPNLQRNQQSSTRQIELQTTELIYDSTFTKLRNINLIVFPNWSQSEDVVATELESILRVIVLHPEKKHIAFFIDTYAVSTDDADLLLSSILMNLLFQEDLDINDAPEISLLHPMTQEEWSAFLPHMKARIVLNSTNEEAVMKVGAQHLPTLTSEEVVEKRVVQTDAEVWNLI
jgi:hypothetical protein